MDATWVEKKNQEATKAYLKDIHNLADYIRKQQIDDDQLSYKKDYAKTILEQDDISKKDASKVEYRKLATACWVYLFKNDEVCAELDELYGQGFCRTLNKMDEFNPNYFELIQDMTFELPKGDYVITDPFYFEFHDMHLLEHWLHDTLPSIQIHDTLCGNWTCTMFRTPQDTSLVHMSPKDKQNAACGRFSAGGSQVCVVSMKDIADYDKEFAEKIAHNVDDNPLSCSWATIIPNFRGTCKFEIVETFSYEDRKKNFEGYALHIIFDGVDTYSGEPVRYESRATSPVYPYGV